ncbi:class I SAM-dependent DNA methyltransferase [Jannaschia ovalis]|uniref:Methyltransferase domain-containing protein n=1 Tax=Jannaschia ovalis TaxID=3038773 RepID=A0ABY8LD03_9RHOB|nr:class I SAM-dependent methyltransferase [Jannaschia sp. GRR-S6-38]WGH78482.1 methyltransferase domain-containing protein [Jannaschia sp. GRR-S6-38]
MSDPKMPEGLWQPRSVEETMEIYADWATRYDADLIAAGYATPARVAAALAAQLSDRAAPVLDFGCGTGLSGMALAEAGFTTLDGIDVSAEMLEQARAKGVYRDLTLGTPGAVPEARAYAAVVATGVISTGAAPAGVLDDVLAGMAAGALLALSFNEAALRERSYLQALTDAQLDGRVLLLSAEHGPHVPTKDGARSSTVYVLRRT